MAGGTWGSDEKAQEVKFCCQRLRFTWFATFAGPGAFFSGSSFHTRLTTPFSRPPFGVSLLEFVRACCGLQCFGGFELLDVEEEWRMFYMASVAALVVTFLFLQLIAWRKPMDIHYVGVELSGSQVHPTTGTSYE